MLKFRSDGSGIGGAAKTPRPTSTSSTASFGIIRPQRPPLPRRQRKDRRLSSLADDTGRTSVAHSPATLDDTNVSIASEAAANDKDNNRQPRSRSADYRFFDADELKTPITTYRSYSRFADISLAPDEVFEGEAVGGGGSMASIPSIMMGGKTGGRKGNGPAIGSTLQLNPLELADVCLSTTSTSLQHSSTSPFTLAAMRKR